MNNHPGSYDHLDSLQYSEVPNPVCPPWALGMENVRPGVNALLLDLESGEATPYTFVSWPVISVNLCEGKSEFTVWVDTGEIVSLSTLGIRPPHDHQTMRCSVESTRKSIRTTAAWCKKKGNNDLFERLRHMFPSYFENTWWEGLWERIRRN